jgi:hypothetical protein
MKAYTPEELDRMVKGAMTSESNICQVLGKALGYPAIYVADGPEGEYIVAPDHPGARPTQDVCVGEHVAETLADEAANRLMLAESCLLAVATMLKIDPSNDLPLGDEVIIAVRNLVEQHNTLQDKLIAKLKSIIPKVRGVLYAYTAGHKLRSEKIIRLNDELFKILLKVKDIGQ